MIFLYVGPSKIVMKNGKMDIADHYEAINEALIYHGFETTYTDTIADTRATPNDLWIGNLSKVHRDSAFKNTKTKLPKKYIIWYFTSIRKDNVIDLQLNINNLCDLLEDVKMLITYESVEIDLYTTELGMSNNICYFVPHGYSPFYENYFPLNHNIPKTIDILFYGAATNRRRRFIHFLRANGLNVYWAGESPDTPSVYEQERSNLISQAKIILYISPQPPVSIGNASTRLGYLITSKAFTIMEGNKYSPFMEDLGQYVPTFYDRDEMVQLCIKWLQASNSERNTVIKQAYDFLKEKYNMHNMLPIDEIRRIHIS